MSKLTIDELVEWTELINECKKYDIPFEEVKRFINSQKEPKQLMARIYNKKFKEEEQCN